MFRALLLIFLFVDFDALTAQSIQGSVSFSAAIKPVTRRSPYGKPASTDQQAVSKRSIAVWLEGAEPAKVEQVEPVYLDQKEIQFSPRFIAIRQGEKVRVRNSDPVYHNVFSLSSVKKFDIGRRQKGEFVDVSFEKEGLVQVFCDIHSHMNAEILVVSRNAVYVLDVEENQSFNIQNIPAGSYTLKAYATGYKEFSKPVQVDGKALTIDIKLEAK